jgi:streptogramin lyase
MVIVVGTGLVDLGSSTAQEDSGPAGPNPVELIPGAEPVMPHGVWVDVNGSRYVADGSSSVVRLDACGNQSRIEVSSNWAWSDDVAVDSVGTVYVANRSAAAEEPDLRGVRVRTSAGAKSVLLTDVAPGDITVGVDDALYVTDPAGNRVLRVGPDGKPTRLGFTGLQAPSQIGVDGAGRVYVASRRRRRWRSSPATGRNRPSRCRA